MAKMNYPQILNDAWQQHLRPKPDNAPTVISLFAGCGGSSLGYSMARYKELLAVEWNDNAVQTFKLNFPDVPIYHGDIAQLSIEKCREQARLTEQGQLDLLDGSPPCQGFSTTGKRILDDPRNFLFKEFLRLLRGLRPKVFVMENVSGLIKGKMKLIFSEIMKELKSSGYQVRCELMDAKYFYVPQSRKRLIFIGIRNDLKINPSHPIPEIKPIIIRDAWVDIEKQSPPYLSPKLRSIISKIPVWHDGGSVFGAFFSTKRFSWNKPARTLIAEHMGTRGCCIHPDEDRAITEAEAKRCHSYPDEFIFIGGYKKAMERIGNSVPPLFMRSIALHIKGNVLERYHTLTGDTPQLGGG